MSKERRLLSPFLHANILLFVGQIFKTVAEYDHILQKMTLAYARSNKKGLHTIMNVQSLL